MTGVRGARTSTAVKVLVAAMLLLLVVLPLVNMFATLKAEDLRDVFTSSKFAPALVNTVTLGMAATAISLTLAFLLALATERVDIRYKAVFSVILVLPMLIPSISHGMGSGPQFPHLLNDVFTRDPSTDP